MMLIVVAAVVCDGENIDDASDEYCNYLVIVYDCECDCCYCS